MVFILVNLLNGSYIIFTYIGKKQKGLYTTSTYISILIKVNNNTGENKNDTNTKH